MSALHGLLIERWHHYTSWPYVAD